jgi:predicted metal-dependent hydrolase
MTTTELEVNGRKLICNIQYKRIRHAYLRIKPNYQLDISLPRNRSITAESILENKRRWIEKKVKELSRVKKIYSNNSVLYQGEYRKVELRLAEKANTGVTLDDGTIVIYSNSEQQGDALLVEFLCCQTLAYVQQKAMQFAQLLGVKYKNITTKKTKSWGYCTRQGNISFNWRLICLPLSLVDFIVFHELLHLKHFNHSKRFKSAMAEHFVNCKDLEASLKNYIVN